MSPWILLLSTLISVYITLETLGVIAHFKQHPKTLFTWIWGERGKTLYDQSPNDLKQYIVDRANLKITTVCVVVTLFLANATFNAFIN